MLVHGVVHFDYVPLRSEEPLSHFRNNLSRKVTFLYVLCNPSRKFKRICAQSIRSYTFCAPLPANSKKDVLKSYVPIRSEQPSRISRLICYVPSRSDCVPSRSTSEFNKNSCFSYVPKRSVQQYRENNTVKNKMSQKWDSIARKCRGGSGTHPYIIYYTGRVRDAKIPTYAEYA